MDDGARRRVDTLFFAVGAAVVVLAVGLMFGGIALALGGDRVVPCDSLSGLDALMGEQVNHVDGPDGGGGCIVPTTAAWTSAIVAALVPVVLAIWLFARLSDRPA